MQDPDPLPWGTQDRFQSHFIVRKNVSNEIDFTARTILTTEGHFGSKKIKDIKWNGGKIAEILNNDSDLKSLILKQSIKDATIFINPTNDVVRIYGKWKNLFDFNISKELYDIYNKIAGHIKSI